MSFKTTIAQFFHRDRGWIIAFGAMLSIYLYPAFLLTTSYDFNDDTEKFVAARLLHSGLRLYKDIFVQHGPVAYIPSHIFYSIFGSHSLAPYRIIPIILSLFTLSAVMASPLFTTRRIRLFVGILFLFGLVSYQAHYAFVMTMYQVYAGYLYVISLAIFILPFSLGISVKPWQALLAGFCLSMLFFCAFSYAFAILFCFILCGFGFLSQHKIKHRVYLIFYSLAGGVIGTLLVALWLWIYGDFVGYFVDHVYINLKFYGHYLAFSRLKFLEAFLLLNPVFLLSLSDHYPFIIYMLPILLVLLFSVSIYSLRLFGSSTCRYILYFIFMTGALIYINPRVSGGFGASTYVLTCTGFIVATAGFIIERRNLLPSLLTNISIFAVGLFIFSGIILQFTYKTFLYETSTFRYYKSKPVLGPIDSEEMRFLRKVVGEEEKVLQLPFSLYFYVHADRLPASGIFFWMPWMNDYSKDPLKGYPLDLCRQMNENPPKAIHYTDFAIWNNSPDIFMGCFKKLLKERYFLSNKVTNVWFRDDVVISNDEVLETSFVPEDYNNTSLSKEAQNRINKIKSHYAKLSDVKTGQCVLASKEPNGHIRMGNCDDKEALKLSFKNSDKLFSLPPQQCLDLPENGDYLRLWSCYATPFQNFTAEKTIGGFYIRNKARDLCLAIKDNYLTSTSCNEAPVWKFL